MAISIVTDAVIEDVKTWVPPVGCSVLHRLSGLHPIQIRDSGAVRVKAVYLALGINLRGEKELLGLWIAQTEGAKFWFQVVTELKNRGVNDIFIVCGRSQGLS